VHVKPPTMSTRRTLAGCRGNPEDVLVDQVDVEDDDLDWPSHCGPLVEVGVALDRRGALHRDVKRLQGSWRAPHAREELKEGDANLWSVATLPVAACRVTTLLRTVLPRPVAAHSSAWLRARRPGLSSQCLCCASSYCSRRNLRLLLLEGHLLCGPISYAVLRRSRRLLRFGALRRFRSCCGAARLRGGPARRRLWWPCGLFGLAAF
jgi:hypothetical protein